MGDFSFYSSVIVTTALCLLAMLFAKYRSKNSSWTEQKAKRIYSFVALAIGVCGGTLIFHGLVWVFRLAGFGSSFGHGEIIMAAVIYNFIIGLVFLGIGRIIIGWKKLEW